FQGVQQNVHEDGLHHCGGGVCADRLGAAADIETFHATDDGDQEGEQGGLGHAQIEVLNRDVLLQYVEEHGRRDVQRQGADHGATEHAREHADEGQHGQRDDHGDDPGDHQNMQGMEPQRANGATGGDREQAEQGQPGQREDQGDDPGDHQNMQGIEPQRADGVDFLVGLHRADLGGEGTGGASGHEDGCQQHGEFAQEGEGDQVDGIDGGAEVGEDGRAEKGDDGADHEGQQGHNGHRIEGDLFYLGDDRGHSPGAGAQQAGSQTRQRHADEGQQDDDMLVQLHHIPAQIAEQLQNRILWRLGGGLLLQTVGDARQQYTAFLGKVPVAVGELPQQFGAQEVGQ